MNIREKSRRLRAQVTIIVEHMSHEVILAHLEGLNDEGRGAFLNTGSWVKDKMKTISEEDFLRCYIQAHVYSYETIAQIRLREIMKVAEDEEKLTAFLWPLCH